MLHTVYIAFCNRVRTGRNMHILQQDGIRTYTVGKDSQTALQQNIQRRTCCIKRHTWRHAAHSTGKRRSVWKYTTHMLQIGAHCNGTCEFQQAVHAAAGTVDKDVPQVLGTRWHQYPQRNTASCQTLTAPRFTVSASLAWNRSPLYVTATLCRDLTHAVFTQQPLPYV